MSLKWYLIIISACVISASVIISSAFSVSFWGTLGLISLLTVAVIIIDAITATVCRLLPAKYADFEKKQYTVTSKEKMFYEKIKIRAWKEKVPEIGHFTGFRKNKIAEPDNPEYVKRFLTEICYGELGHFYSVFTGFSLVITAVLGGIYLSASLTVSFVNGLLNILPIMVLRYNSYKLKTLYKRLQTKRATVDKTAKHPDNA